jgi:hypothetical protein
VTARLVYDIPETAELLGCSEQHVYNLISAGFLKRVDIRAKGRSPKTRILHDDLVAFLNSRKVA